MQAPGYLDDQDTINNSDTLPNLTPVSFIQAGRASTDISLWASNRLADLFHFTFPWPRPFYFRILTVLMHSLAATLLAGLVYELCGQLVPAAIAGVLFLVHPIQSEAVIYIGQRAEAQAALFMIAAVLAYVRFRKDASIRSLICVLVLSAAAVSSKESALIVLAWLGLVEAAFFFDRRNLRWLLYTSPILFTVGLYGLNLYLSRPLSRTFMSWPQYVLSKGAVLDTYLRLVVFPRHQSFIYDLPAASRFSFLVAAQWLIPLALLVIGLVLVRKRPLMGFGLLSFFVLLLPDILVPRGDLIFEYRVYPAFAGLAIAIASIPKITNKLVLFLLAAIVTILGYRTVERAKEWTDSVRFYETMSDRFPKDSKILTSLGVQYMRHGMFNKSLAAMKEARKYEDRLNDYYRNELAVIIATNLGYDYLAVGKIDEAKAEAKRAMGLDGQAPLVLSLMGTVQTTVGEYEAARKTYTELLKADPENVQAWNAVQAVLLKEGNTELAKMAENRSRKQLQIYEDEQRARFSIPKKYAVFVILGCTVLVLGTLLLSLWTVFEKKPGRPVRAFVI